MLVQYGTPTIKLTLTFWKKFKREALASPPEIIVWNLETQLNYHHLGWPSFVERRLQAKLTILQKARLKLLDLPLDKIQTKSRTMRLGGVNSFARNCSPVNCHFYLFFPQTTQLWNDLPLDTGSSEDIDI